MSSEHTFFDAASPSPSPPLTSPYESELMEVSMNAHEPVDGRSLSPLPAERHLQRHLRPLNRWRGEATTTELSLVEGAAGFGRSAERGPKRRAAREAARKWHGKRRLPEPPRRKRICMESKAWVRVRIPCGWGGGQGVG